MKTKILIGLILIVFISGCSKCPETCDDNNPCTADSCGEGTDFQCAHVPLNGKQPGCSVDVTCGTKTCKDGVCKADYENSCCGNEKCETGETYDNCPDDCPYCDDDNKCTKDRYDYHEQKCINELIVPCCDNEICDEDAETYLNCPVDCPNCDDNDRLTTDSFNYETQECENVATHYFFDDFEEGIENWEFYDGEGKPTTTAWSTTVEEGNTVLRGTGHNWANLQGMQWDDYIFKAKFKVIKGSMHFNYRLNNEGITTRYRVSVSKKKISLSKSTPPTHVDLSRPKSIQLDKKWHTFEMRGYDNILNVYIDDELLIKYKDTNNPSLSGRVAFETLDGAEFLIDDVEIKLITEEDIISP